MHLQIQREFSLTDRLVVVTGAASGIGRETARVLALAGARLALAEVNAAGLAETRELIEADGGVAVEHLVDVTARPAGADR